MTKERRPTAPEGFPFTANEQYLSRVSDVRFRALVFDPQTTIYTARIDGNNYGEFVFITVSRPNGNRKEVFTFWGGGYHERHERRDRWIVGEWFYHRAHPFPATLKRRVSQGEVEALLSERQADIAPYAEKHEQSRRGEMFEDLAALADDDAIAAEMDDLGGLPGALFDDVETETSTPTSAEILRLKEHIWRHWEQLPPEHQATITMVMVQTVMNSEYEAWMHESWQLLFGKDHDDRNS